MFLRRQGEARRSTHFQSSRRIKRTVRRRHSHFNKLILKYKLCKQREVREKKKEKKKRKKGRNGAWPSPVCDPVGSHPMSIHIRTLSMKYHQPPPDASGQHCRCSSTAPPFLLSTTSPTLFSSSLSCPAALSECPHPPYCSPAQVLLSVRGHPKIHQRCHFHSNQKSSELLVGALRQPAELKPMGRVVVAGVAWFPLTLSFSNLQPLLLIFW
jgi:hypothetical protein